MYYVKDRQFEFLDDAKKYQKEVGGIIHYKQI